MNAVETRGLTKRYGDSKVVDSLDISIESGTIYGLLGVNGSGKSTSVKMMTGLLEPTCGDVYIMGEKIPGNGDFKRKINISTQETAVAPNLTVYENLEFMAGIYGIKKDAVKDRCRKLIDDFSMNGFADRRAKTLSGGEARRLSIAMALINEPCVIFLDEPTLGLDVISRRSLWRIIENIKGRATIVLTTHYIEEAEALCDKICVIVKGKPRVVGTVESLKRMTNSASLEDAFVKISEAELAEGGKSF